MGKIARGRRAFIALTVLAVAGLASGFNGCSTGNGGFAFKATSPVNQPDVIGNAELAWSVCAGGDSACPSNQTAGPGTGPTCTHGLNQLLIAVRIPATTTAPASFVGTASGAPGSSLTAAPLNFTASPSYVSQVQANAPARAGKMWTAYISDPFTWDGTTATPEEFGGTISYSLMRGADGSPFHGPFQYRAVVGCRAIATAADAASAVDCTASQTHCLQDSVPSSPIVDASLNAPTRDLGIISGATGSGAAGGLGAVPFVVAFSGPASPVAFSLSATGAIPGATATVNPATLTPSADSINVVPVVVSIPAGTAPGQYPVALTAKLANGAQRSANGTLTVLPPAAPAAPPVKAGALDAANPGVTLYVPNGTLRLGSHTRTLKVVSLNVNPFFLAGSSALFFAGDASGRAHRADNTALPIATQGLGLPAGQHTDIYYNLSETALKRLRKRRSFPVVVALRLFDAAGHSTTVTARYTLAAANRGGR